jgi:hypothetical protein
MLAGKVARMDTVLSVVQPPDDAPRREEHGLNRNLLGKPKHVRSSCAVRDDGFAGGLGDRRQGGLEVWRTHAEAVLNRWQIEVLADAYELVAAREPRKDLINRLISTTQ